MIGVILWVPETRPGMLNRGSARHDRILATPPVRLEAGLRPDERADRSNREYAKTVRSPGSPVRRSLGGTGHVTDRTIRVDRAVLEIHQAMTAARAKPQVSGPDEFSTPTRSATTTFDPTGPQTPEDH
jgi:hypothetical protein